MNERISFVFNDRPLLHPNFTMRVDRDLNLNSLYVVLESQTQSFYLPINTLEGAKNFVSLEVANEIQLSGEREVLSKVVKSEDAYDDFNYFQ